MSYFHLNIIPIFECRLQQNALRVNSKTEICWYKIRRKCMQYAETGRYWHVLLLPWCTATHSSCLSLDMRQNDQFSLRMCTVCCLICACAHSGDHYIAQYLNTCTMRVNSIKWFCTWTRRENSRKWFCTWTRRENSRKWFCTWTRRENSRKWFCICIRQKNIRKWFCACMWRVNSTKWFFACIRRENSRK